MLASPANQMYDLATLIISTATLLAEVSVAGIIWYEVEQDRQRAFLARSQDAAPREARKRLYGAFFAANQPIPKDGMDAARKNLLEQIERSESGELREACVEIVTFANELAFAATRPLAQRNVYIDMFPQGWIFVWLTVGKYVLKRRKDSSTQYAEHMLVMTLKCLERIRAENGPLVLHSPDERRTFEFTPEHLMELRDELKTSLESSRSLALL